MKSLKNLFEHLALPMPRRGYVTRVVASAIFLAGFVTGVAYAATNVQDSVQSDVGRELTQDSNTPADFTPFLNTPAQGAQFASAPAAPASLPATSTPLAPTGSASAPPTATPPNCGQELAYYDQQAGFGATCTCPSGLFSTTPPVCTCANGSAGPSCSSTCSGALATAQANAGSYYTCSCAPPTWSAVQTVQPTSSFATFFLTANWPDANASFIYGPTPNYAATGASDLVQYVYNNPATGAVSATLYLVAEDAATVSINGQNVAQYSDMGGTGSTEYPATGGIVKASVSLPPGQDTIQIAIVDLCSSTTCSTHPNAVAMSIIDGSGNVLVDTTSSWQYESAQGSPTPTCTLN